jgi:hypothetical protein
LKFLTLKSGPVSTVSVQYGIRCAATVRMPQKNGHGNPQCTD